MRQTRPSGDNRDRDDFSLDSETFEALRMSLMENRSYLEKQDKKTETSRKIGQIFDKLHRLTDEAEASARYLEARACEFDVDEETPASGYRSLLVFTGKTIKWTSDRVKVFTDRRSSWFFREDRYLREIHSVSELLLTMVSCMNLCKRVMDYSENGDLILNEKYTFKELLSTSGRLNQYCVLGRFNSAQLSGSLSKTVRTISLFVTLYGEIYYRSKGWFRAILRCFKVIADADERALKAVAISQYASPNFFKSFMNLPESRVCLFFIKTYNVIASPVAVNQLMSLPPEKLTIDNVHGRPVCIPVPTSHIGRCRLPVRLLSATRRSGMEDQPHGQSPSNELVIHFHGGGFICHTSTSHEGYLRRWTRQLNCPIASVDYSLSPEAPYPRPVEEAFYAYCYALKYPEKFGWTGEKLILAGDSAGGVLAADVILKTIEYNIRPPDGAVLIYTPFQLAPVISPGRFLSFLDPILSIGVVAVCCKCYLNRQDLIDRYEFHERKLKLNVDQLKKLVSLSNDSALGEIRDERNSHSNGETDKRRRGFWSRLRGAKTEETDLEHKMIRDAFNPVPFSLDDFDDLPNDFYLSPMTAPDDVLRRMPPVTLVTTEYDAFIDDNIQFAKRLKRLGVTTRLQVLEGLNHGFLNLTAASHEAKQGSDTCCQFINDYIEKK